MIQCTPSALRLSLQQTLCIGLVATSVIFALMKPVSAIDLAVFLRMGQWMLEQEQLLEVEPFALAALGKSYQNGTWLAQLLLVKCIDFGGYPGVQLLLALTVLASLGIAAYHLVMAGGWKLAPLGLLWVLLFLIQNLAIRPQNFAVPLFATCYFLLDQRPAHKSTAFLLFMILALWSNLHGAFPLALFLPGVFWITSLLRSYVPCRRTIVAPRRYLWLAVIMMVGTWVNPYGPAIYFYVLENSSGPVTRGLAEWLPPTLSSFLGFRFFVSLGIAAGVIYWCRRSLQLSDVILLVTFGVLGARSQRMIVWWGVIAAPILVRLVVSQQPRWQDVPVADRIHILLGRIMLAFWAVMVVAGFPGWKRSELDMRGDYRGLDKDTPASVATFLKDLKKLEKPGRMFHRLEWGSYFMWRLWPEYQTFIDIRVWIFSDEAWQAYLDVSHAAPGWQELLDRYQVNYLVLSKETQSALIEAAAASPHWSQSFDDAMSVVFERALDRDAELFNDATP